MRTDQFLFFHTYFLFLPYIFVLAYFYLYERDSYFLKVRSGIQLSAVFLLLCVFFIQNILWIVLFPDIKFLNFGIINEVVDSAGKVTSDKKGEVKATPIITILAATAAVCGWVFTSRVQIVNATKAHAMQALMNSRNSGTYTEKVDIVTKLREKKRKRLGGESNTIIEITKDEYLNLKEPQRAAIHYMLNFLEFISVGVRHNNMDEELIKGSLETILKNNYLMFRPVIEYVRLKSPSNYIELEILHKRWNNYTSDKCGKCAEWFMVDEIVKQRQSPKKHPLYVILTIVTVAIWNLSLTVFFKIRDHMKGVIGSDVACPKCIELGCSNSKVELNKTKTT